MTEQKSQKIANQFCLDAILDTIQKMRDAKPADRSELDRRYAIVITDMEKVYAYFYNWIIMND